MLRDHRWQQLELRLQMRLGKPEPDTLVFSNVEGEPPLPNNLSRRWQDVYAAQWPPLVMFHALRHTHRFLIAAGSDVVKVGPLGPRRSDAHAPPARRQPTADAVELLQALQLRV